MKALVTLVLLIPILAWAEDADPEAACRARLKRLSGAIRAYRLLHEGKDPAKLSDLFYDGLVDSVADFACPVSGTSIKTGSEIDARTDYTRDPLPDTKGLIIREKAPRHKRDSVVAAFADGTVKAVAVAAAPVASPIPATPSSSRPAVAATAPSVSSTATPQPSLSKVVGPPSAVAPTTQAMSPTGVARTSSTPVTTTAPPMPKAEAEPFTERPAQPARSSSVVQPINLASAAPRIPAAPSVTTPPVVTATPQIPEVATPSAGVAAKVAAGTPRETLTGWKVNFDGLALGPLPANALASFGIASIEAAEGRPTVEASSPEKVLPQGRRQVLSLTDCGRTTCLMLRFTRPITKFSLTRIGLRNGASVPPWRLQALNGAGNVVSMTGEAQMSMDPNPREFSVQGTDIVAVRVLTDNRYGTGALATYSALPVAEFALERLERMTADTPSGGGNDQSLIQGAWVCVTVLNDGNPVGKYVGVQAIMQGDRLTWIFPQPDGTQKITKAVFRLDASRQPKHFDWYPEDKPQEIHQRLYRLEGDTLIWSTNMGTEPRPQSFSAGRWQFIMQRIK